ncbi:MAG: serine/threonine protein kinase [Anaerolineales bacterium]
MSASVILNNRYELLERLGAGGMAVVYRAHDQMLDRDVAIKILREKYTPDEAFRERFRQEARAAANLSHPNIVTIHDFGYDHDRLYIVMEYVPGNDLKVLLSQRGHFSVRETIALMIQACAGVGFAHRSKIIHCDIKSQNFLITPDQRLKVTDFGIARALATIQPEEKSNVVWGSPQYFSPEQAAGLAPTPASDVYSLGVVCYEMLTGQLPFNAPTVEELARCHREDPPPPPSRYNPAIPPTLELTLLKVLSKEPSARYRNAEQFGQVLINLQEEIYHTPSIISTEPLVTEDIAPTLAYESTHPAAAIPNLNTDKPELESAVPLFTQADTNESEENPLSIDWITIFLGLLALLAVGGLIPLWIWVYYLYQ